MDRKPKILAFAGSTRTASWNKKLAHVAAEAARSAGGDVTEIDLRDFPMPLYDGDIQAESGLPETAKKLKQLFIDHDALLIASPEYNASFSAVLKNSIDWISRSESKEEPALKAFDGKVAAILSTSPGALGGLRGLTQLRGMLGSINVLVLPAQLAVPSAPEAFDADGKLKDGKKMASVESIAAKLVATTAKLR